MQKSLILRASMITEGASFSGVLNGSGNDYRTISAKSSVDVGTLAFSNESLRVLSRACVLNSFSIKFDQKVNINTGGTELRWEFTPRKITNYSVNGTSITVKNTTDLASKSESKTNGGDWINNRTITLFSGSDNSVCGSSTVLGFYLKGVNPAVFKYQLYMRNLSATFTYTARYYARFYNENGALANEQLLEANEYASITEVMELLEKPGYDIRWWEIVEGEGKGDFADYPRPSVDKDIGFKPYYVPKTYSIEVYPQRTDDLPGLYVEKKVNGAWNRLTPTRTRDYVGQVYAYYACSYGDVVRFVADGYRSDQNLVVSKKQGFPVDVEGTGQPITVDEKTVDGDYNVSIRQVQDIAFPISTSAGTGGTITAPQSVPRHGSADVVVTPNVGYELETVTIDDSTQEADGTEPLTIPFADVTTAHSVSATFARIKIPIDLSGLPDGITVQGPREVNYGDSQTWVFGCDSNHSLLTITVDNINLMDPVFKQVQSFEVPLSNITNSVAFGGTITRELVTVAIQQNTGGTVSGDTGVYVKNTGTVPFSYALSDGYGFVKWFDNSTGRTVDVSTNTSSNSITVSATFEPKTIKIHADAMCEAVRYNGDNVSRYAFGGANVQIGDDYPGYTANKYISSEDTVTIKATPKPGFVFYRAMIGSTEVQGLTPDEDGAVTVTVATPTADKNVYFYFRRVIYDADISASSEACSVSIDKKGPNNTETQYHYGSELQLTATPGTGWYFRYWSDDNANQNAVRDVVISANDVEISAVFKKYEFEQTVETHEGGKVTVDGSDAGTHNVEYGDELLLTITADYGRKIKDVLLDGVSVIGAVTLTRRGGAYLLHDITAQHHIEVFFETRIYTNSRKLLDYYPPVIKSIHEIRALMEALQVQNNAMWDAVSFLFENQFIESATNEGVTMWERELGIIPAPTDTLQQRKERLRIKWVPKPRFTMRWLTGTEQEPGWLEKVCGQPVPEPVLTDYSLRVTLPGGVDWMTIFDDLKRYKPANIVLDPRVLMPRGHETLYVGTATMISNHDSPIKYTLTVEGE